MAKRYLKFNLESLLEAAVNVCKDTHRCKGSKGIKELGQSLNLSSGIKVLKLIEGLHNKAFLLTMDNGIEVVVKVPNPNAGPARYTTASEVATRQMVCM